MLDASLNIVKARRPDLITPPKADDLDVMLEKMQQTVQQVRVFVKQIDDAVVASGRSHDKKVLFAQVVKFFLEHAKEYDRTELEFAWACSNATILVDQIV